MIISFNGSQSKMIIVFGFQRGSYEDKSTGQKTVGNNGPFSMDKISWLLLFKSFQIKPTVEEKNSYIRILLLTYVKVFGEATENSLCAVKR